MKTYYLLSLGLILIISCKTQRLAELSGRGILKKTPVQVINIQDSIKTYSASKIVIRNKKKNTEIIEGFKLDVPLNMNFKSLVLKNSVYRYAFENKEGIIIIFCFPVKEFEIVDCIKNDLSDFIKTDFEACGKRSVDQFLLYYYSDSKFEGKLVKSLASFKIN